jgi:hypothetical protein
MHIFTKTVLTCEEKKHLLQPNTLTMMLSRGGGGRLVVHAHAGGLGADHGDGVLVVAQHAVRVQTRGGRLLHRGGRTLVTCQKKDNVQG